MSVALIGLLEVGHVLHLGHLSHQIRLLDGVALQVLHSTLHKLRIQVVVALIHFDLRLAQRHLVALTHHGGVDARLVLLGLLHPGLTLEGHLLVDHVAIGLVEHHVLLLHTHLMLVGRHQVLARAHLSYHALGRVGGSGHVGLRRVVEVVGFLLLLVAHVLVVSVGTASLLDGKGHVVAVSSESPEIDMPGVVYKLSFAGLSPVRLDILILVDRVSNAVELPVETLLQLMLSVAVPELLDLLHQLEIDSSSNVSIATSLMHGADSIDVQLLG